MFTESLATMWMSSVLPGFPVTFLVRQAFLASVITYKIFSPVSRQVSVEKVYSSENAP